MTVCSCETANKPEKPIEIKTKPKIEDVKKGITELEYYAELVTKYQFEDYPNGQCEAVKKPAKPDVSQWKKHPEVAHEIKKKYLVNNPDYDCKYKVVTTFCGSPCQVQIIFNSITGKPVEIIDSGNGVDYQLSSSLLVVNPADETPIDTANFRNVIGPPVYWQMRNGKLHKLE